MTHLVTLVKTSNQLVADALIRHQTYLLRYSGYVRNRINGMLNSSELELIERIQSRMRALKGLRTPVEWKRLQKLQAELTAIRGVAWDGVDKFLQAQMTELAYAEPLFMQTALTTALPVVIETTLPSARLLRAIALARPFEGRVLKDWAANMRAEDLRRIHAAVQTGMVVGESMDLIARRVIGTGALKGVDGVTEITRRNVQAITRTAVMHVANSARQEFLMENADVMVAEVFVATLDSRTTVLCAGLDGQRFEPGKGPQPPLHFNCRSLRVAGIDGAFLGDRPAKPYVERELLDEYSKNNGFATPADYNGLPYGHKTKYNAWKRAKVRELVGPIPASTDYNTWLRSQSVTFQDDVLGVTKARLYRDGGLSLDKFVNRQGDELTLAELAKREKAAFKAAGLNVEDYLR